MALDYGFLKCRVRSDPILVPKHERYHGEIQFHVRVKLTVNHARAASDHWQTALNVGTDDEDDLLRYKLIRDFRHPIRETLHAAQSGYHRLTGHHHLPALDFLRSDLLVGTGSWHYSDVMEGRHDEQPTRSLMSLLRQARETHLDVYVFGRAYTEGRGIHDVHMNQGSSGHHFFNDGNDHKDHNDIWQDGALLVDLRNGKWAAYFSAFEQQHVPTDSRGNPIDGRMIDVRDENSLCES